MNKLPPITIIATTWFPKGPDGELRRDIFVRTVESWHQYLCYAGQIRLHVADDGSEITLVPELPPECTFSQQHRHGVGASLNAGIFEARKRSPLVLYAVDDWALTAPLDLTSWAELLMESPNLGAVRLGPPHPDLTGQVLHLGERGWGLLLDRHHYAFSFRPILFHERFFDAYGPFPEDVSSLEAERQYNERFAAQKYGLEIMLALYSPWDHIYGVELSAVVPNGIIKEAEKELDGGYRR